MTAAAEEAFDDLLEAILDGEPIDWTAAESAAGDVDPALLDRLKLLASVVEVHRSSADDGADPVSADRRWGHLRVLELIGRGTNGSVYRAWDEKLDREVALKLLPARAPGDGQPTNPIIEEGRALARVRHPNVVTLYGADLIGGHIGLWMERVTGRTLEAIVRDGKKFTAREVAALGVELARAVGAVHAAGLVHRDIKASNVMIANDGRPVLMDFGTGRDIADAAAPLAGTPLYLAPELWSGGGPSPRSDVYSLGVLLHHLLTGSYPVVAADLPGLRRAHARGERVDVHSVRRDVPAKLASVLGRAVDPDPARRQPSADALAADLDAIANRRFGRSARAITAAAALLLMAGGVWELRNALTDRPSPSRALAAGLGLASAGSGQARAESPAIVVLPFDNLGELADDEHFVDGLADEILRELARVDGLSVRSRYSSFSFRDQPLDLRAVAERLRVNLAITGSVRRSGDRLRVSAQLTDLRNDRTLWADSFDRRLVSSMDVFAITDEISRSIVNELRLTLGAGQRRYDLDVQSYDLYLRARAMTEMGRASDASEAIELFERILAKDPAFAPAYAGLASAYFIGSLPAGAEDAMRSETVLGAMREAAAKALELDPLLADAHAAMGVVYARELQWEDSEKSFYRALDLDPARTSSYTLFSLSTLRPLGKYDEARRILDRAREQDPLSLDVQLEIGVTEFTAGRYEDAIKTLRPLLAENADLGLVQLVLARSLTFAGRIDEALAVYESMDHEPGPSWYSHTLVRAGRRAEAEALARANRGSPHRQLFIQAALGNRDLAFAALERLVIEEPQRVPMMLTYPELEILRGDPRLAAIRRRFRLP